MRHKAVMARILIALFVLLGCAGTAFAGEESGVGAAVASGNYLLAIALAFGFGILTSFTGCVYPMIPITVAVFGARQAGKLQGFLLSLAFVEGIAAMFTGLGVIAALTGSIFGAGLSNPWVTGAIGLLFAAMALSMFGLYELSLPSSVQTRLAAVGGRGYGGAFLMGIVAGIIASPCTGPPLASILAIVAAEGKVGFGALLLLVYAHGLGLLFVVVGTFAASLPKPGRWMEAVKSVFGIVLLAAAVYFLKAQFPWLWDWAAPDPWFLAGALGTVGVGLAVGAVHLPFRKDALCASARKAIGIAAALIGIVGILGWSSRVSQARGEGFHWIDDEATGIAKARAERRPRVIDFTARWCVACEELARETFPAPAVAREASRFVAIRIDSTRMDDRIRELHTRYTVRGLPTVVLFDSAGRERKRITGFVPPERFVRMLRAVR